MRATLAVTAFVALMMPTTTIANAQLVPTCFGRGATYVGTAGDDYIYKRTSGIDVWVFLGGDDYMDDEDLWRAGLRVRRFPLT